MTRTAAVAALVLLASCGVAADPRSTQVEIGQDTFYVLIEQDRATVSNFATGFDNTLRLRVGARAAMESQTDCTISDFFKFDDVNKYQARLICPPNR
ncbi:hypothetical protein [Roseicitreum antarcticum]|uniref:Uncharacterized protein n=1 Tax=Roseicitreum antarcticum TaxID=564137 RepID=A0A1H2W8P6_9RHOB|nr:hypothetical protein [Roseicitreum antarcticum]SDW77043.1 hypothetical protein SAMN04488238_103305 [Roseicitreum antarcticum]